MSERRFTWHWRVSCSRLLVLRRAYILAALIATAAGYVGFFHLLPGYQIFLDNDRVSATFKDPNVYGPFLILPLLLLVIGLLTRGVRLFGVVATLALLGGLFLSFSRGAWLHFGLSAVIAIALLLATTSDPRMRGRIVLFGILAALDQRMRFEIDRWAKVIAQAGISKQ